MQKKSFTAFSLVELSVVVIIVGILIAGATQGARLIDESRLKTARDLTINSRVASMEQLVFWYEPTLVSSFSKADAVDGAIVDQWNDNNPQSSTKLNALAGQKTNASKNTYNLTSGGTSDNTRGPTYIEDGINHIPTLRFINSSTEFQYLAVDPNMRAEPQDSMTVFIVSVLRDTSYGFLLSGACLNSSGVAAECYPDQAFGLEVSSGGLYVRVIDDSGAGLASFTSNHYDPGFVRANGRSYIITVERNYGVAFTTYINGNANYHANSDILDSGESITVRPFKIGRDGLGIESSNMDISEIIFFSGAIKKRDRQAIEDYLGKKYNIPVLH